MTEKNLIGSLEPGDYAVDDSAHKHVMGNGKTRLGFRWHAVSRFGAMYTGVELSRDLAMKQCEKHRG